MEFLSPTTMAWAAGLTIPPLVALYFLKLKRVVRLVPSTFLWRRAVEDLHVNSPFQRLRKSLLLLLQLLCLILAALALGQPFIQKVDSYEQTSILLIDQSASMGVIEADGRTRLEEAKRLAKRVVDNLESGARAMVIAYCDRATVVASFSTEKQTLKARIDSIEVTDSSSTISEAMSLAEAYTHNITIGGNEAGADVAPVSTASPASVFVFTDGRIEDADKVALQRFDIERISVVRVGERGDNVGIIAMDARRNFERPQILEVAATVENFGDQPQTIDAVLYVDGQNTDVQTVTLGPTASSNDDATEPLSPPASEVAPALEATSTIVFDEIEFGGGGVVEVVLRVQDALAADDRAWAIVDAPRQVRLLLVGKGNLFLENVLATLPVDVTMMKPQEYEDASKEELEFDGRSLFDVVMIDRHSTSRLPRGNYMFWEGVPLIEGVKAGEDVEDEIIFNWDETHPVLRHVAVEVITVFRWVKLFLPSDAEVIVEGPTSPVLSYLKRGGSQYLVSAFSLVTENDQGMPYLNTYWVTSVDFVVFMQNVVGFLSSNLVTLGTRTVRPGDPVVVPIARLGEVVKVERPDGIEETMSTTEQSTAIYARTRQVGTYQVTGAGLKDSVFVVNLFNDVESRVLPATALTLGANRVEAEAGEVKVNRPLWRWALIGLLMVLLLEWVVYNKRVMV